MRNKKLVLFLAATFVLNVTASQNFLQDEQEHGGSLKSDRRNPDEELVFAFELVRHGARGPLEDRDLDKFSVGEGQLTPEGMRQRYLLGRYSRERYTQRFPLLSPEYNPEEFYIQSTNVNRTMQSGYSELMGLYPPGQGQKLTKAQQESVSTGPASPPFKVRNAKSLNSKLGQDALPGSFEAVEIHVYNNADINDDVSADGCPFIGTTETGRADDQAIFDGFDWMISGARGPIQALFDLSDDYIDSISYHDFYHLADTAVALDFEGYPEHKIYFSDDQWELVHEFQKVFLAYRETINTVSLEMSRLLRKPILEMRQKVATLLKGGKAGGLKFMIYSAHDDQVINMLNFLAADFFWVPYSSTVTFELKYSVSCLESDAKSEDCFGVSVRSNGTPLLFDGCSGDKFVLEGCSFPEFEALMQSKWYEGPGAPNLDAACFETPAPPPSGH